MSLFAFLSELRFNLWEMMFCIIISCAVFYTYFSILIPHLIRKVNQAAVPDCSVLEISVLNSSGLEGSSKLSEKNVQVPNDIELLKLQVDEKIRLDQLYENPHLNIERLAQLLDLPVRKLSLLIKTGFSQNYFEFINGYRLSAVKERLVSQDWADSSVQDIYESVGFSSRSTFFTLFKKREGITPAEYRFKYRINHTSD